MTSSDGRAQNLSFETLVSGISAQLITSSPEQLDDTVQAALDQVRLFFDVDRCGLLAVHPDASAVTISHSAMADGVGADVPPSTLNLMARFPWCTRRLLGERQPVIVPRVVDLPAEASVDRASFLAMGTRSNLTVPVFVGSAPCHLILFGSVHTECDWPAELVPRVRLLGEMFVNVLERRRAFEAIREQEELLRRAATAGRCGLWELRAETGAIRVTVEARRLYGVADNEPITYDAFLALVHDADREGVATAVQRALSDGAAFRERYRVSLPGGGQRWILATGRLDDAGRLVGASVDVTAEVEASERAREQAARVAAAIDVAELGFTDWTVGAGPPHLDDRLRELIGFGSGDDSAIEAYWVERIHPDDRDRVLEQRRQLVAGEIDRFAEEYRFEHPSRGSIWLRHTSRRLAGERAGYTRVVGALQDITEHRRNQEDLRRALEDVRRLRDRLEQENLYLRHEARERQGRELIVGRSQAIRRALTLAEQVAPTDATVLLLGETGCGKERFATFIHEASRRRERAMIRVNCAAIPVALIESELFGREKGAFTGAASRQVGRFELAHGSTLFLDEIGDLPAEVQVKLLRVLEEHTIERLGSPRSVRVDVRIIAATHRDLRRAVADGTFREDLFYRLNVFPLPVPPLRDRLEDIPLLVDAFLDELAASMGKRVQDVEASSIEVLAAHAWPGNIRELRNVIERAMILADGPVLRIERSLLDSVQAGHPPERGDMSRDRLLQILQETGWRIRGARGAAARLGMRPTTLEARIKRFGITRPGVVGVCVALHWLAESVAVSF